MENRWASPQGLAEPPRPVRYRILDAESGEPVERTTLHARDGRRGRYYYALHAMDQHFANAIVDLVQQACSYFRAPDDAYDPLDGVPDVVISDDEVRERIARIDEGENTREAERTSLRAYPLTELPWDQQRALIEQIEHLKATWQFEILGESDEVQQTPASDVLNEVWPSF